MSKNRRGVVVQLKPEIMILYRDAVDAGYDGSLSDLINKAVTLYIREVKP